MYWVSTATGLARRRWRVRVEAGPDTGRSAVVTGDTVLIGAAPASVLALSDDTVSRYHAELDVLGTGLRIRDLRSTNGTYLADREGPIEAAFLWPGARFRLGESWLCVEVEDEVATDDLEAPGPVLLGGLVGRSAVMQVIFRRARRLASGDGPVLLTGPVGSGRAAIARQMHRLGPRAERPLQAVEAEPAPSIEALSGPDSPVAKADEGTLLLRDVDRYPRPVQTFLRTFIERGVLHDGADRLNVRLLATCSAVHEVEPTLRRHLGAAQLAVPGLEARPDELVPLAEHFLRGAGWQSLRLGQQTALQLRARAWPGQVAELAQVVRQLPAAPGPADEGLSALAELRQAFLTELVGSHRGDVTAASKDLATSTSALFRALHACGVDPDGQAP